MREKLSKFFNKDGFYFILFICVCIVAIAAVMVSKDNLKDMSDDSQKEGEDFIILENEFEEDVLEEDTIEIAKIEDNKHEDLQEIAEENAKEDLVEEDIKEEIKETDNSETEDIKKEDETITTLSEKETENMVMPVSGTIGTEYTEDNLIYSETLDEWTSHKGIDIMAAEGTEVVAALSGNVSDVYEDPLWGIVVIISHGDNLYTKYANLSEEGLIEKGDNVNKGDVIGKVGTTAAVEMMMDPHIHFEVIKDGVSVNPNEYIPALSIQTNK